MQEKPTDHNASKWCPEEALTVVTSDALAQKARISAIKSSSKSHKKAGSKKKESLLLNSHF